MRQISIKSRVFILALIPTLLTSLLLGAFLITSRIHDLEKEQRIYAITLLNHIVNISRNGIFKNNKRELQEITQILHDERELQSITFFDKNHAVLAYGGDDAQDSTAKAQFGNQLTTLEGKDTITLIAPVIVDDLKLYTDKNYIPPTTHTAHKQTIGWVAISLSRTKTILEEYQIIIFTLILLAISIAISIFFARKTSKYLTQPLIKIAKAIKKIEEGELETRIDTETGGEICELANDINKMATALQRTREDLQSNIEQTAIHLKQSLSQIETQKIELIRAQKEASEASRIKSEFIANMSHEIRTPMNSIVGYTNLLLETDITALQRNYLTTIQRSTLNLLNLVNNVLDFSRLDAGQLKLDYIPFDLHDCIEEIMCIMAPLANAKQLEFTALIDDSIPQKIISDPLRIKQVILNLVSNAIKFTELGEIILRVTLEKKSAKFVKLRISISDTGIGMSQQDQKNIFRAFQQADTSIARKYGGTGLGLAICKKLIDQLAGKIGVESNPEQGSTFWFTFSADKVSLESNDEYGIHFSHTSAILFEPHAPTRQALKNLLIRWEIEVIEFSDFDALISYVQSTRDPLTQPTFLIAGINQQQIQNASASHSLATIKKYFSSPIIVLTNSSEQATLEYFIAEGATASLTKPIIRKNLYHVIFSIAHSIQAESVTTHKLENEVNLSGKQILCVDDNLQNTHLVKALLENTQATVTVAFDGMEAVQLAEKQLYDLILMDIRMPKLDGYEALKIIRTTQNKNNNTPVIAVSAHISQGEHEELLKTGFNGYLIKPIIKPTLLDVINLWIFKNRDNTMSHSSNHSNNSAESQAIDWNLGVKLAGNKRELAEEMLNLLIRNLPTDIQEIKLANEQNDYHELLRRVHKLHGALCYCGVPRLKAAAAALENKLKKNKYDEVPMLFDKLEREARFVLEEAVCKA